MKKFKSNEMGCSGRNPKDAAPLETGIHAGNRIPEQRYLRRPERKHHKQHPDQTNNAESKPGRLTLQPSLLKCPPFQQKDNQCGEIKDSNVEPVRGFAKGAVVGIKQHRNQDKPQQNLRQLDAPAWSKMWSNPNTPRKVAPFGEHFRLLECRDCSLEVEISQVFSAFKNEPL